MSAAAPPLGCGHCGAALAEPRDGEATCPRCATTAEWTLFPAANRPTTAPARAALPGDSGATCFHHPSRRAERICDGCGRFLCALCDVAYHDQHLCPACIAAGAAPRELRGKRYIHYQTIALHLALVSWLFFPVMIFTVPAVIYLTVRYARQPIGYFRKRQPVFAVALLLTILQTLVIGAAILASVGV